MHEELMETLL